MNRHPKPAHALQGGALLLWDVLKKLARTAGTPIITPTRDTLARLCGGVDASTISRWLAALDGARWIRARHYPITDSAGVCVGRVLKITLQRGHSVNAAHSRELQNCNFGVHTSHSRELQKCNLTLRSKGRAGGLTPPPANSTNTPPMTADAVKTMVDAATGGQPR